MNIMMWAGLLVLVAYNGNAELATLGVMLLTIVWAADEERRGAWCRALDVDHARSATPATPAGVASRRTPGGGPWRVASVGFA